MRASQSLLGSLPDVAADSPSHAAGALDWVGMSEIELPVRLAVEGGLAPAVAGSLNAFVDLQNTDARGIHMSRLYLLADRHLAEKPLTPSLLAQTVAEFLDSHDDLSTRAKAEIAFDYLVRRPALKSEHRGWKRYPVRVSCESSHEESAVELGVGVLYSSTCPCSAALSRQLIQESFEERFGGSEELDFAVVRDWLGSEEGIRATPHSQRSRAEIRVRLDEEEDLFPFLDVIDAVEGALKTPVQAAVKREDEQAFAELNASNLMFCEDAARRIQAAFLSDHRIRDFYVRVNHYESLHPHDAVAVVVKGVPGGYRPD